MREIKFRAWDKEINKMIYSNEAYPRSSYKFEFDIVNNFEFTLSKIIDRFNVKDEEGEDYCIDCYEKVDAEIMQYTGLEDRNGKEIYEGDIVEFYSLSEDGITLGVVSYDEGMYIIGDYILRKHIRSCAVKGNIYENPELLK